MTSDGFNPANGADRLDLSGRQLGDFRVVRRLGQGAMADVYLAEQASLRRPIALKVLKRHLAGDGTYLQRFHNEAMAAAALTHANIVQIHEVGQIDGVHFIAQEYVAGRNLGELIGRRGPLPVELVVAIMRQVAAALARAAEQGIVHRDIKPENIMLARTGEVKVADFGLARIGGDQGLNLTQVGMTMGTPLYMAPEQVEGRALDVRADIYSLGVTCYHMLTGRPPFTGETALAVAVQHLNVAPEPLSVARPDVPPALAAIVEKMMGKKPEDRFASPRELLQALRALPIQPPPEGGGSDSELSDGSIASLVAAYDARQQATVELEQIMHTSTMLLRKQQAPRRRWFPLVLAVLGSLAAGGALALVLRPSSMLADAQKATVPKRPTAWAQLYHAKLTDSERAWQSVAEYYPQDQYAIRLAQQGLVRHYLWSGDVEQYRKALPLCDELMSLGETEVALRAFGIAGKCIAQTLLGQEQEASRQFDQLTTDMIDRLDPRMRRLLQGVMSSNRAAGSREAERKIRQLRQDLQSPSELGSPGG